MKLVRFSASGQSNWGRVEGDIVRVMAGSPFDDSLRTTETVIRLDEVCLLPPSSPSKIVCIGSNYRAHCAEMGRNVPETPKLFLKPPSALIASGEAIRLPKGVGRVDYEGELAVIVGRRARHISPGEVDAHVLGYTLLNDVTARELQRKDVQFTRAKGFDTFCPVGPVVVSGIEPTDLSIKTFVDGELRQHSNTSDMVFDVRTLVSFISKVMTLIPGDIVSTGTPSGVAPLRQGERVAVSIPEIGVLENVVEAE